MPSRSPVVAILGHVDHGKTTLLDYIRKSHIASGEHGGITQKIGAYEVETHIKGYSINKITFIDTPGHEAFSLLRARGANVADIAILIVDARDSLMPQTIESISHIKSANIPFIVAINKIDLEDANPEKIKNDLLKYEVLVEGKGGDVPVTPLSAKTGKGVDDLLETILFIASDKKLQYDKDASPKAYIIETKKDRRGIVLSAIIKDGILTVGDIVYAQEKKARIRSLINDKGQQVSSVSPSTPFELLGFEKTPEVGSTISTTPEQKEAETTTPISSNVDAKFDLAQIMATPKEEKKLSLVIKSDSQGSLEAINAALSKNEHVDILLSAVGDIHKSDVFLAKTTRAIVIGFNVKPDPETKDLSKQEKVIIKTYSVIYELLDELNEVADLLQEKEEQEKSLKGEAKVLALFTIEGEKVFGVKMVKGKITAGDELQLHRNDNLIGKTRLVSLQVRAKKVQEVKKDQESGMVFSPPLDIRVGDMVKCIL
ncbi:translation initiation factor IF-2 [Candidatus Roizmanbacteria bacterium RIFOXYB2_FULL_38_10]|uniref:Translation initiation factor IF-2 n=1 Tax=Candidatus Roizmanbacteria bacterium RIFOXYD1_FULL_38_12 TaxID=1802093 RepID=A0A1F7KZM8_9BACT|nr:MAG: translation initiation factor IF-2 [Candidatus Roizmanbacteria bacterium RIFOXYA2_FULL_38_14]OGK63340.1 MAG: translation initiation factor IF-2 [Candidatus Roizmanbacteria bacterium RIFOXYA1_FULL_37_12]OGK65186.1 MAG: translation initiation factor IF-2 [Candidatus Roizmanbacteria bacterium RIFOXYB1_FULL_40_23]OGK68741.1 MAG: translation initiation factor IF-2 [Candidatus Roizmanbacteria bacterium RIFOXYB2_FULL_38_10]OGK69591.1 MAG: translation initiation factor IF-2 [Candidatus Roizmanb